PSCVCGSLTRRADRRVDRAGRVCARARVRPSRLSARPAGNSPLLRTARLRAPWREGRRAVRVGSVRTIGASVNHFDVRAHDGAARACVLHTKHGDVPTPAFMPVGTKATVKLVDPDELRSLGTTILLGNTYHLHFRPGEDLIAELGGLHQFMGWGGPILTDSGGFQVFSLRDTLLAADDDGVTFRSVYDGSAE